ncbi:MAG: SpoIVB peptidase [Clostridia bacterium]|nr:SpoIVB peptidase [Clostridia bacterium]
MAYSFAEFATLNSMMYVSGRKKYTIIAFCLLLVLFFQSMPAGVRQTFGNEPCAYVYAGGFPIGLVIKPKGVIVVGAAPVETELGNVLVKTPFMSGDIIENINGTAVNTAEDIRAVLSEVPDMTAQVRVRRGTSVLEMDVSLIKEDLTGEKRLGLQIRENVAGVGTVTYVKQDGSFGCLGHPIGLESGGPVPLSDGASFVCKIMGVNKGLRGKAGELKGAFASSTANGSLYKNCQSGVYGKFDDFKGGELIEVAHRKSIAVGKATILATIGDKTEEYGIEIIKTAAQNSASDKSMIVRVTDKRLIGITGGIVQGMSGSPILQNGKLIGAITHVFISDPTKGYGIYADWMLEN